MASRKLIIAAVLLGSVFAAPASQAGLLYSDGPADGNNDAWTINFGFKVADSFHLAGPSTVTSVDFLAWSFPGDTLSSVDWAILDAEPTGPFNVLASGTASPTAGSSSINTDGYDTEYETFGVTPTALAAGTYWLELFNAVVPSGDPIYWDMNGGPSQAWESDNGDVSANCSFYTPNGRCAGTFDIYGAGGTSVPEPMTLALFGAGIAGLGALRRRSKAKS